MGMDMNIHTDMVMAMDMGTDIMKRTTRRVASNQLLNPSSVKKEKRVLAHKRQRR